MYAIWGVVLGGHLIIVFDYCLATRLLFFYCSVTFISVRCLVNFVLTLLVIFILVNSLKMFVFVSFFLVI